MFVKLKIVTVLSFVLLIFVIFKGLLILQSAGNDPKAALDKALFKQMQLLAQKKKEAAKERVTLYS
jgi:hypothetical protein